MAAELGTFERLLAEVGQALLPLRVALSSPQRFAAFAVRLGWRADDIPGPLRDLAADVEALYDGLRGLLGDGGLNVGTSARFEAGTSGAGGAATVEISADAVTKVLTSAQQIVAGIRAIATAPASAISATLRADGFATIFPRQVIDYLVIRYLVRFHPIVGFALRALGVIKVRYVTPTGARLPYLHLSLDLADLPRLLSDPSLVLKNAFQWGEADFNFAQFVSEVDNLLTSLGLNIGIETTLPSTAMALNLGPPEPDVGRATSVRAVFFERVRPSGRMAAEVLLLPFPSRGRSKPGLALVPSFAGVLDFAYPLGPDISVAIASDLDLQGGVALLIRPDRPIEIIVGFAHAGAPVHAAGSIEVRAERTTPGDQATLILGAPGRTRLQYRKISGLGGVRLSGSDVDVFAEFELRGLEFVFEPSQADGFIAKLIPAGGVGFGSDLTLGISHRHGFYFRGTSQLEIQVPAHVQLGPVDIRSLTISAAPQGQTVPVGLAVTFAAALGPVRAVVEQIGLSAVLAAKPDQDGNLGPLDVALRFKPPKGVGLSIDAAVVTGGGYLYLDPDRGEYAGALELTFAGFLSLKAIGLITTKLPDGSKGFSLLVIISVDFGTGIQLGFGFTLLAVGGLVGLHRAMNLAALTDGVRSGSLTSVMFPKDIVANAPKIISDLRTFFPIREGTFLIGPMARLGWGTPRLVSVSVGVVIEIPGNVAILGVLTVALPSEDAAIILLQVQFVGAIEFDKQRMYFFAVLFDSRVVFLSLTGEMGLLVAWGDEANFVVSVGGFHPSFSPPPLPFPSPQRISVSLLNASAARVSVQGYFAVTSNTVQFGARVEVFFGLSELNVKGHLAFDSLFQFSPFHFVIEISASLSVNVLGTGVFSVGIRGSLDGPTPWHIKGHGSISLLFWDIDVNFHKTWGDERDTQLPPIAVFTLLQAELAKPSAWRALLPDTNRLLVTLRQLPAEEAALVLHPTGVLHISQRALPLGITLDKVGNQQPSDVNRLDVAVGGGELVRKDDAYEQFAPAQFISFSDAEKLSQPAFGPQRSGLDLSATGADVRTGRMVKRVARYEEIIIDTNFKRFARRFRGYLGVLFAFFLQGNAVARSAVSKATKDRLQPFAERITVSADTFVVAFQADNRAYASEVFSSAASAHEFVKHTLAEDPTLADTIHVIPSFEAVS